MSNLLKVSTMKKGGVKRKQAGGPTGDVNDNVVSMRPAEALVHYSVQQLPTLPEPIPAVFKYAVKDQIGNLISKTKENAGDVDPSLPPSLSLLAELRLPLDSTAAEVIAAAKKRTKDNGAFFEEIYDEHACTVGPPVPQPNGAGQSMDMPTPVVTVASHKEAHSSELRTFVERVPIGLIKGLTGKDVCDMDVKVFGTEALTEKDPEMKINVLTQKLSRTANLDKKGMVKWSHRNKSDVQKSLACYARYQLGQMKREQMGGTAGGVKRSKKADEVQFGTNVDLSDKNKFGAALTELNKLPAVFKALHHSSLLAYPGYTIDGMNAMQAYLKVGGVRTPGHMENNNMGSVNLNIGPGACEWFAVDYSHWGTIENLCAEKGLDFLSGKSVGWWPNVEELKQKGVPVYRFTQHAGDLVWVGVGCVHWVQALGACNNISWNVGPITHAQITLAAHQYEWNKTKKNPYYQSLVPLQRTLWNLAKRGQVVTDRKTFDLVRGMLIRSLAYAKMVSDWAKKETGEKAEWWPIEEGSAPYGCSNCLSELFNCIFVEKETNELHCADCVMEKGKIKNHILVRQTKFKTLAKILDNFKLDRPYAEPMAVDVLERDNKGLCSLAILRDKN